MTPSAWKPVDEAAKSTAGWTPVSEQQKPADKGFFSTLWEDATNAPKKIMDFVSGHPLEDLKEAGKSLTEGRKQAWNQAVEAYKSGNYKEAAEHAIGSIPIFGPPLNAAMNESRSPEPGMAPDETHQGKPGQGMAHGIEALLPYAGPALESMPSLPEIATGTGGAAKGAFKAAIETKPVTIKGVEIPVPTTVASAAAGGQAASMMGLPRTVGTVAGAAAPIVRGAVSGARSALAQRLARAMEAMAQPEAAAAVAPVAETPGQVLAKAEGREWASLSAEDRATMEQIAQARANVAAQPPPPAPQPAPASPASMPASAAAGKTLQQLMEEELAAKRGAPAEAPAGKVGPTAAVPDSASIRAPLRPPLAQSPAPGTEVIQPEPAVTEPVKPPAEPEAATGEKGPSPNETINREAKATRYAEHLFKAGVTSAEAGNRSAIPLGTFSDSQIQSGATPGWGNIAASMGEKVPSAETIKAIVRKLREMEIAASKAPEPGAAVPKLSPAEIARQLRDEMLRSGTIQQ